MKPSSMIQRAVQQDPANGAYLDSLGWAYYKQNKLTEAEENLRKASEKQMHDPTILAHLGDVYSKMGQKDRAVGLWEKALAECQKSAPADYEADKVSEIDAQVKAVKRHTRAENLARRAETAVIFRVCPLARNTQRSVRLPAFAKVNLDLRVIGKRPDGYHELRTIFQTISLHDTLEMKLEPDTPLLPRPDDFDDPALPPAPKTSSYRAIESFHRAFNLEGHLTVHLHKIIPVARGLGGGSSDAAATLIGLIR